MTERERLWAALTGREVDRPPIWLREGFNPGGDPGAEALDFGTDHQDLTADWKTEALYRRLHDELEPHVATIRSWDPAGLLNRFLLVPPDAMSTKVRCVDDDTIEIVGSIETETRELSWVDRLKRGYNTAWHVSHLVESVEDLQALADIPFSINPARIAEARKNAFGANTMVGDRGLARLELPSPLVAISATMTLQQFLELTVVEQPFLVDLLAEVTERVERVIDALFADGALPTVANFGGSEQATPPMMAPYAFDEFVVPYDGRLVRRLQAHGVPVNMHAHGRVRHALSCMREMGVDSTDPVEPPPAGDLTIAEARSIVGDDVTLVGNLEFDELEYAEPSYIADRVKEILAVGPRRLVVGASGGPLSKITPQLANNYRSWIAAVLEQG